MLQRADLEPLFVVVRCELRELEVALLELVLALAHLQDGPAFQHWTRCTIHL